MSAPTNLRLTEVNSPQIDLICFVFFPEDCAPTRPQSLVIGYKISEQNVFIPKSRKAANIGRFFVKGMLLLFTNMMLKVVSYFLCERSTGGWRTASVNQWDKCIACRARCSGTLSVTTYIGTLDGGVPSPSRQ